VGGPLEEQLALLREALDELGRRLRESVAQAVGRAVGAAVAEAVRQLTQDLCPTDEPSYHRPTSPSPWWDGSPARGGPPRHPGDDPRWADDGLDPYETDYLEPPCEPRRTHAGPEPGQPARVSRRGRALLLACQAGCWWLRRQAVRRPLLAALGVGLLSAVALYAGAPLALAGAGLAGSALALAGLADGLRAGAAVLPAEPP
jgi:hypothetical protein